MIRGGSGLAPVPPRPFPAPARRGNPDLRKNLDVIETNWGPPLSLVVSPEGEIQKFSTIEQARYWLRRKWPVADAARQQALSRVEAAMDCMAPVGAARAAFRTAAGTAGFRPV